jgi:hypothetical protein
MSAVKIDWIDVIFPLPTGLVWLFLTWFWARSVNAGQRLSTSQRTMLKFGFIFAVGMGYLLVFVVGLGWPRWLGAVLISAWASLLVWMAWHRYQRTLGAPSIPSNPARRTASLRQGLSLVALLISLIASSIEWEYVLDHQGHWLGAMLWSTGVVGAILLAYGNRRATVIVGLRAYLGLLVVGAIAERKMAGLILAGVAGAVYVSLVLCV